MRWWCLWLLWTTPVEAEVPLPSYRDEVVRGAWLEIDRMIEAGRLEEARAAAQTFRTQVVDDGSLAYLIGLSWRLEGNADEARTAFDEAIRLDPTRQDAWSDLGELHLAAGRYDEAERAFQEVAKLVPDGRYAWLGPFRLAEVAGHRGDAAALEEHMMAALRKGFSFRTIEGDPNWRRFYADPRLKDTVEKLVGVFAEPRVLDSLRSPQE